MGHMERQYLDLCKDVLIHGVEKPNRTGTSTRGLFGAQMKCDLAEGFPLITTKKMHFKSIKTELIWMIRGLTDVKWLQDRGVTIWDEWQDEDGTIGTGYGFQWRSFGKRIVEHGGQKAVEYPGIDQLKGVVERIKTNPNDRRLLVSAWNPVDIPDMMLPPCHVMFQFYVADGRLSCHMYQRSADMFLGVPFNIAQYALLTHIVAWHCNLQPGDLIHSLGDYHIYSNHIDQMKTQILREPKKLPFVWINVGVDPDGRGNSDPRDMFTLEPENVILAEYQHHPAIKGDVAV